MLALTRSELDAYETTLGRTHQKRILASIVTRNGTVVENITRSFSDGTLTVDTSRDVTRQADIEILDPRHRLGFDADTYQGGDLDLTRMLRLWWSIPAGPHLPRRLSIPIHTGPMTRLRREGPIVRVEAQGKEVYGLVPAHRTLTLKKGLRRTDAIKAILVDLMGESPSRIAIPTLAARLPASLVITRNDLPWKKAQQIAGSLNRQLYYDGAGVPRLRTYPTRPSWEFLGINVVDNARLPGARLTSALNTEADLSRVINHVRVIGRTPKGKKKAPIGATATADRNHPLSPWNLGPAGAPMYLVHEIRNDHLRTVKECKELADNTLARMLQLVAEVTFTGTPVPHFDPYDVVQARDEFEAVQKRLNSFTLPLGVGGDMQIGFTSRFKLRKA